MSAGSRQPVSQLELQVESLRGPFAQTIYQTHGGDHIAGEKPLARSQPYGVEPLIDLLQGSHVFRRLPGIATPQRQRHQRTTRRNVARLDLHQPFEDRLRIGGGQRAEPLTQHPETARRCRRDEVGDVRVTGTHPREDERSRVG